MYGTHTISLADIVEIRKHPTLELGGLNYFVLEIFVAGGQNIRIMFNSNKTDYLKIKQLRRKNELQDKGEDPTRTS